MWRVSAQEHQIARMFHEALEESCGDNLVDMDAFVMVAREHGLDRWRLDVVKDMTKTASTFGGKLMLPSSFSNLNSPLSMAASKLSVSSQSDTIRRLSNVDTPSGAGRKATLLGSLQRYDRCLKVKSVKSALRSIRSSDDCTQLGTSQGSQQLLLRLPVGKQPAV